MPKICKKCNKPFPYVMWIDNKKRNFKGRKYCLECSPFGSHNTRKIHIYDVENKIKPIFKCKDCGRDSIGKRRCNNCWWFLRKHTKNDKVYKIVGEECWYCNWTRGRKGRPILDFHHMNPETKSFCLTSREVTNLAWNRIILEMQKCCLLCTRCHRELEFDLIEKNIIEEVYKSKWRKIKLENPTIFN